MRKGSLQLGINAIVILVLAIVLLGLGIGLIRNWFEDFEDVGQISEQVKNQIMEDLQQGDKKMSVPTRSLDIGKRDSKTIGIGIKNVGVSIMPYVMKIEVVGGDDLGDSYEPIYAISKDDLLFDRTVKRLDISDASIAPIKITTSTDIGNVIIKVSIMQWIYSPTASQEPNIDLPSSDPNEDDFRDGVGGLYCPTRSPYPAGQVNCWDDYASETFFVTVR